MYLQLVRNLNLTALLICIHYCTLSYRLRHTGIKTNLQKTFQFVFGDLVAVHLPKDRRNWKFDMR